MKGSKVKGWSDIKWGVGDEVALAACKLTGAVGQMARYREFVRGAPPLGWRYRWRRFLRWFFWCTGTVRRTQEMYWWAVAREDVPSAEELGMTEEVRRMIFTDHRYEPRWYHPFNWVLFGGLYVYKGLQLLREWGKCWGRLLEGWRYSFLRGILIDQKRIEA